MVIGYSTCRNPIKFPLIGKYDFINGIHKKFFWVIRKRYLPLKFNKKEYHLHRWYLKKNQREEMVWIIRKPLFFFVLSLPGKRSLSFLFGLSMATVTIQKD